MHRKPVISTTIEAVGYDRTTAVLEVEFAGGNVYEYFMVPHSTYLGLLEAPSIGRYFGDCIRGRHQFRRL